MTVIKHYGEVADILAQMAPEKIASFKASKEMSKRVEELVVKEKEGTISKDESMELERLMSLNLLMNLAKAQARLKLAE